MVLYRLFFPPMLFLGLTGCPATPPQQPGPLPEILSGTIDGASFTASSLIAERNADGFLIISAADYSLSCTDFSPGEGIAAHRLIVGIDDAHQQIGVLHLELPSVADANASVVVYSQETETPLTVVLRKGEVTIAELAATRVRGTLDLSEPSRAVNLRGPFDVGICESGT